METGVNSATSGMPTASTGSTSSSESAFNQALANAKAADKTRDPMDRLFTNADGTASLTDFDYSKANGLANFFGYQGPDAWKQFGPLSGQGRPPLSGTGDTSTSSTSTEVVDDAAAQAAAEEEARAQAEFDAAVQEATVSIAISIVGQGMGRKAMVDQSFGKTDKAFSSEKMDGSDK